MVTRLTVALEQPEYSALLEVASRELRTPADQLRYILLRELAEYRKPSQALSAKTPTEAGYEADDRD